MLKHKCYNCGTEESYIWHTIAKNGLARKIEVITLCDNCYHGRFPKHIIGLTDLQRKKLSWYKDDRKWQEDISGRKVLPSGKVGIYDGHGNLKEIRD